MEGNWQMGHFPSTAEIDYHDAMAYGEQHPEIEWILSDRDVFYRNLFYSGVRTPHPYDLDNEDDEERIDDVLRQHNFITALPIKQYHSPYDNVIEDDDIPF